MPGAAFSTNTIVIEGGGIVIASTPTQLPRGISIDSGGVLIAPNGLTVANDQAIAGRGTVLGPIELLRGGSIIASGGTLSVGDASRPNALLSNGTLHVDNNAILHLQSTNAAFIQHELSMSANSRLAALNGISLATEGTLIASGAGVVDGRFVNSGTVHGPTMGELRFLREVSGSGRFTGNVSFADVLSPGNSIGTMTMENPALESRSELLIEIQEVPGTSFHDQINVQNRAKLAGLLRISFLTGSTPVVGQLYSVLSWDTRTGQFSDIDVLGLDPGLVLIPKWNDTGLALQVAAVPEPSTWAMWLAGLYFTLRIARWHTRRIGV